jgi:hypothetical protein
LHNSNAVSEFVSVIAQKGKLNPTKLIKWGEPALLMPEHDYLHLSFIDGTVGTCLECQYKYFYKFWKIRQIASKEKFKSKLIK